MFPISDCNHHDRQNDLGLCIVRQILSYDYKLPTMILSLLDIQRSEEARPWLRRQRQRGSRAGEIVFEQSVN